MMPPLRSPERIPQLGYIPLLFILFVGGCGKGIIGYGDHACECPVGYGCIEGSSECVACDSVNPGVPTWACEAEAYTGLGIGGGSALDPGEARIQLRWMDYVGPGDEECSGEGPTRSCTASEALDLGQIHVGREHEFTVWVENAALCPVVHGEHPCAPCKLDLDPDGDGMADATIDSGNHGAFRLGALESADTELSHQVPGCNSRTRITLLFGPVSEPGEFAATLTVRSDSHNRRTVHLPLMVKSFNGGPVAIAKRIDDDSAPASGPAEPFERLAFDGSDSFDADAPSNPERIVAYHWEVTTYPAGANPDDFRPTGVASVRYGFTPTLAGRYVVQLRVTNEDGTVSRITPESTVDVEVVPPERLHVQLVWDEDEIDQDLHMTLPYTDDRICNDLYDVHWLNRHPVWFPEVNQSAGNGPNPSLDVDDLNGFGPENINIDEPVPGRYRIYVHYYADLACCVPSRATVRVFVDGRLAAEFVRTLAHQKELWAVADVVWRPSNTAQILPYPSDTRGETGSVSVMEQCGHPGRGF